MSNLEQRLWKYDADLQKWEHCADLSSKKTIGFEFLSLTNQELGVTTQVNQAERSIINIVDSQQIDFSASDDIANNQISISANIKDGSINYNHLNPAIVTDLNLSDTAQQRAEKGQVNGYASLDAYGIVPKSQLPLYIYNESSQIEFDTDTNINNQVTVIANVKLNSITKFHLTSDVNDSLLLADNSQQRREKGRANGYASLNAQGIIPASQLPSFVDDVLEYNNISGFPATGEKGKIYIDKTTGKIYRWGDTLYVEINSKYGINSIVEDDTPILGGDLDLDHFKITSTPNRSIFLSPGNGNLVVEGNTSSAVSGSLTLTCEHNLHKVTLKSPYHAADANYTLTLPDKEPTDEFLMQTDASGQLSWFDINSALIPIRQRLTVAEEDIVENAEDIVDNTTSVDLARLRADAAPIGYIEFNGSAGVRTAKNLSVATLGSMGTYKVTLAPQLRLQHYNDSINDTNATNYAIMCGGFYKDNASLADGIANFGYTTFITGRTPSSIYCQS